MIESAYAYLLGLYLGDGDISRGRRDVFALWIACCLFPQHGPGRKHMRIIELEPWQPVIVRKYPGEFARGLFHSGGWRGVNRVRRRLLGGEAVARLDEFVGPKY